MLSDTAHVLGGGSITTSVQGKQIAVGVRLDWEESSSMTSEALKNGTSTFLTISFRTFELPNYLFNLNLQSIPVLTRIQCFYSFYISIHRSHLIGLNN